MQQIDKISLEKNLICLQNGNLKKETEYLLTAVEKENQFY